MTDGAWKSLRDQSTSKSTSIFFIQNYLEYIILGNYCEREY